MAAQVAGLLLARGFSLQDAALRKAARKAGPHVERGFKAFHETWRELDPATLDQIFTALDKLTGR